jgi:hypothetical protein
MPETCPPNHRPTRVLAVAALVALGVALCLPGAAIASPLSKLTPTVTCVDVNTDGSVTAHWGYVNSWNAQVTVQVGNKTSGQNWFSPGAEGQGQPTSFDPGTSSDVFTVTFSTPTLTWTLDDSKQAPANSATASATSTRCAPVPALGVDSPLPLALLAVAMVTLLAWRSRRSVPVTA